MAAIGWTQNDHEILWQCGGSLISKKFVITAAHCAYNRLSINAEPDVVRLGELAFNETNRYRKDFVIEEIITHPQYKARFIYQDIALLRLKGTVEFSKLIRPACLWTDQGFGNYSKVAATGWGSVGQFQDGSNILLKVNLDLIDNESCSKFLKKYRRMPNGLIDTQMCSGVLTGGKDTCEGDSGGPLQVKVNENRCVYHVLGLTSFGFICGGENQPAIYTRISSYLDWIEDTAWK
jgi:secreted trypsin-like serine protease